MSGSISNAAKLKETKARKLYGEMAFVTFTEMQSAPFFKLLNIVIAKTGGKTKAFKTLGIPNTTGDTLLNDGRITDKAAKVLLANYKLWKAGARQ